MTKAEIIKRPADRISGEIKRSAWGSILESLAILVLGILLVVWPQTIVKIAVYIVGTFFVVKGAFQIINYFMEQGQKDFFNNGLLFGVVSALIGVVTFVIGTDIMSIFNIFRVVVGIFLIYISLVKMNTAVKLHAAGILAWKYVLILALVILALGIFVTVTRLEDIIGWMMIAAGLIGIVSDVLFIQYTAKLIEILTGKVNNAGN